MSRDFTGNIPGTGTIQPALGPTPVSRTSIAGRPEHPPSIIDRPWYTTMLAERPSGVQTLYPSFSCLATQMGPGGPKNKGDTYFPAQSPAWVSGVEQETSYTCLPRWNLGSQVTREGGGRTSFHCRHTPQTAGQVAGRITAVAATSEGSRAENEGRAATPMPTSISRFVSSS